MSYLDILELNGIELLPFEPCIDYFSGLSLLVYLAEDVSYISCWVHESMSIYRHGYEDRLVGIEFWLPYNPQLLLR
jgi:hypothetical protein